MINTRCKLKLEDIQFKLFLEEISEVISTADMNGNIIFLNKAGLKILQYEENDIDDLCIEELHPKDTYKFLKEVALPATIESGSWKGETKLLRKDGKEIDVLQVIVAHRNDDGELEYLSTILKDISEEKQIAKNLHDSEEYRKMLFSQTYAPNVIIDPSRMCVVECNEAAAKVFGFTDKEDLKKTSILDVSDIGDSDSTEIEFEAVRKIEQAIKEGESYFTWKLKKADGTPWVADIHLIALPWGEKTLLQAFVKDITEALNIENEKKVINEINKIFVSTDNYKVVLDRILHTMMDFFDADRIWLLNPHDLDNNIFEIPMVVCKPEWVGPYDMKGPFNVSDEAKKHIEMVLHSEYALIQNQNTAIKIPDEIVRSLGAKSEILKKMPFTVGYPWVIGMHFCEFDKHWTMSEQKFFEELANTVAHGLSSWLLNMELQDSKEYIDRILDSMPSIIIGIDERLRITHWNEVAIDKIGFTAQDVIGEVVYDVVPLFSVSAEEINEAITTKKTIKRNREKRVLGEYTAYMDTIIYPVKTEKLNGAVIRIDDVTEKVKLQESAIKADKMAAINGLAAGIAHEIKNPLAGVMQTMQVMENRLKLDSPKNKEIAETAGLSMEALRKYISLRKIDIMMNSVKVSGKRADSIINNMLNFTQTDMDRKSQNSVKDILEDAVELASNDYVLKTRYDFHKIHIVRNYEEVPYINCEPVKLKVAFFNLLKNGTEAMSKKNYKDGDHPEFVFSIKNKDSYIEIGIEDNGKGIIENNLKQIFNPFYSTKPEVYGTGLSLPISYFIIRNYHDGDMTVDSIEGEWARFTIRLPI